MNLSGNGASGQDEGSLFSREGVSHVRDGGRGKEVPTAGKAKAEEVIWVALKKVKTGEVRSTAAPVPRLSVAEPSVYMTVSPLL